MLAGSSRSAVSCSQPAWRVFRDAVEYGDVAFNPFKAVKKPTKGPSREAQPLTPMQVERLATDDGELDRLKNRKRSRKRSRTVD
ncbi:MAG: hypothetical protein JWR63_1323 [Conexibacter sp.]|nr:hypothetical protein [Conexibacter sp.]